MRRAEDGDRYPGMTVAELMAWCEQTGVPRDAVALDGGPADEAYVLEDLRTEWVVYYSERGRRTGERRFATEAEACLDVQDRLVRAFSG